MTTLTDSLSQAWLQRARGHLATLQHAAQAPALFRPEFVEQERARYDSAIAQARRWSL